MNTPARRWFRWHLDNYAQGYQLSSSAANLQEVIAERYHWYSETLEARDVTVRAVKAPPVKWLAEESVNALARERETRIYRREIDRLLRIALDKRP